MLCLCLRVIHDHPVGTHQPVNKRLDVNRALADFRIADDHTSLYNISGDDFRLQTGINCLNVHLPLGELAAFNPHPFDPAQDRDCHGCDVHVVDPLIPTA